jgi:hypothetical protein
MIHGSCLCKAVRLEVREPLERAPEACHCTQCREQTGTYLIAAYIRRSALKVLGKASVAWYRSSATVERGFCRACGSTLFWRPDLPGYEWTGVAMGCFDTPLDVSLAKHSSSPTKAATIRSTMAHPSTRRIERALVS